MSSFVLFFPFLSHFKSLLKINLTYDGNTADDLTLIHHRNHLCFWSLLYIPFMHNVRRLTPHHWLTLSVHSTVVAVPLEIWTSNLYLCSDPTSPCKPYLLIDTLSSWHDTDLWPLDMFCRNTVSVGFGFYLWPRFFFIFYFFFSTDWEWQRVAGRHIFAPPHMLCSLFRLLPPCHSAQVPSLTCHINF